MMAKIVYGPLLSKGREKLIEDCASRMDLTGVRYAYLVPTRQLQREVQLELLEQMRQGRAVFACPEPQVYLFDGFVREILKEALAYQIPLRADQQEWIIRELANQLKEAGCLPLLQDLVGYEGFYQSLSQWLTEVKGTGATPAEWLTGAVSDKERELGRIYEAYEQFLTDHELVDQERNYSAVIRQLERGGPDLRRGKFAGLELVVIDGFYKLTQLQLRLVKALMEWGKEVVAHLFLEEAREDVFLPARKTAETLAGLNPFGNGPMEHLPVLEEGRPAALRHLCTQLFQLTADPRPGDGSVSVLYTPDPYQEMEVIGRQVKEMLLAEEDLRLGDVAVILRNVETVHSYIDEVFRELGIPYTISLGTPLARTPIFRFVMKLYRIFAEDWSRESVLEVLKSSYLRVAEGGEAEQWEAWILEAGIIGGESDWMRKLERLQMSLTREAERALRAEDDARDEGMEAAAQRIRLRCEEIRELREKLQGFFRQMKRLEQPQTLFEHGKALMEFLAFYRLDRQIVQTGDFTLLRRDLLSLNQLRHLLDDLVHFGGLFDGNGRRGRLLQPLEFLRNLQTGAGLSLLQEAESGLDAVQILTPSQSRGGRFKRVFIGGLLEGEFPWYGQRDWLFTPEERRELNGRGIRFEQFHERLEEERLFFLEAAATATERLTLCCPALPEDETKHCSSFLHEVQNLYSEGTLEEREVVVRRVEREYDRLRKALTRRELDENLLREMWEGRIPAEAAVFAEPAATLETKREDRQREADGPARAVRTDDPHPGLTRLRDLFLRGTMVQAREGEGFSKYDGLLTDPAILDNLSAVYHPDRVYSISQINEYATCPFQFFCKRILHLDRLDEPELRLEPLELGNIYHQILFRFFRDFPGWEHESLAAAWARLQAIAADVLTGHPAGFQLPAGLWTAYRGEIAEHLERMISFEYEEAERQGYVMRPALLEASFGLQKGLQEAGTLNHPEPVVIMRTVAEDAAGEVRVRFSGKIDRIDLSGDGRFLIIYDYKFGRRDGLEEIEAGIDLQLPLYVKAAKMICGAEKEVLGAGYFSILQCDWKSGIWRDLQPDLVPVTGRNKNCLSAEEWERQLALADEYVIRYIQQIRSGDFRVNPAKCPKYCKFSKICRFDQARHRRKTKEPDRVSAGSTGGMEGIYDEI